MLETDVSVVLRLLAAAACGIALGFQRDLSDKPLGMRTLALVSLGAAIATVAMLRYPGLREEPEALARILQGTLQGVLVGVGFIGAGVILRDRGSHKVHGLTTATTVWIAAALGLACGVADWPVVITGLVLALIILVALKVLERRFAAEPEQH